MSDSPSDSPTTETAPAAEQTPETTEKRQPITVAKADELLVHGAALLAALDRTKSLGRVPDSAAELFAEDALGPKLFDSSGLAQFYAEGFTVVAALEAKGDAELKDNKELAGKIQERIDAFGRKIEGSKNLLTEKLARIRDARNRALQSEANAAINAKASARSDADSQAAAKKKALVAAMNASARPRDNYRGNGQGGQRQGSSGPRRPQGNSAPVEKTDKERLTIAHENNLLGNKFSPEESFKRVVYWAVVLGGLPGVDRTEALKFATDEKVGIAFKAAERIFDETVARGKSDQGQPQGNGKPQQSKPRQNQGKGRPGPNHGTASADEIAAAQAAVPAVGTSLAGKLAGKVTVAPTPAPAPES